MHSSLKIVLYAIKKIGGVGGGGGVDVFEDPYITAKMIFTQCSQFHKGLSFLKIVFTFRFFCRNFRMSDILEEPPFDWFINLQYYDRQHSVIKKKIQ